MDCQAARTAMGVQEHSYLPTWMYIFHAVVGCKSMCVYVYTSVCRKDAAHRNTETWLTPDKQNQE